MRPEDAIDRSNSLQVLLLIHSKNIAVHLVEKSCADDLGGLDQSSLFLRTLLPELRKDAAARTDVPLDEVPGRRHDNESAVRLTRNFCNVFVVTIVMTPSVNNK
jgi:hypothetical protein